jgi:hypothetical protein
MIHNNNNNKKKKKRGRRNWQEHENDDNQQSWFPFPLFGKGNKPLVVQRLKQMHASIEKVTSSI